MIRFAEKTKLQPILGPIDIVATATASNYVDLVESQWITFLVSFGVITTGTLTVTAEASTAGSSNATEAAVPFSYRLSGAVATDSMGAITSATSAGVSITASDDNKILVIDIDPAALPANPGADYSWMRLVFSPTTDMAACVVGAAFAGAPRYPGNSMNSVT